MLPMMILQPSDITSFDNGLDRPELLPQEAVEPSAAFADILELGLNNAREFTQIDGTALPLTGKDLPQELAESPATAAVAPINVLVPQVEPVRTDSRLTPATPVQITPLTVSGSASGGVIPSAQLELSPDLAAAPGQNSAAMGKPPVASVEGAPQAATEQVLRDKLAGAANTALQAPRPALLQERSVSEIVRDLPAAPLAGGYDADALDTKSLPGRRPMLNSGLMPPGSSTDAVARQSYEDMRNELPRDLRIQAGAPPVPQVAQAAVSTTNPLEIPAGQQPQINLSATPAVTGQASSEPTSISAQLAQTINVPVKDAAWGDRIGERVLLMASNRLQSAEIRLSPAELGPLRVQVAIDDGAANVTFLAQHAVTREALEQAMPRLRELLAENGLTLNQTNIGEHNEQGVQHGSRDNGDETTSAARAASESEDEPSAAESNTAAHPAQRSDGLVDTFV
jgi:flagellar hook-length control protein FliK